MYHLPFRVFRSARVVRPAGLLSIVCCLGLLAASPAASADDAAQNDHQQAVGALADVKAAISELVGADASYVPDPKIYHRAAQRAINALAGTAGDGYVADPGSSGDAPGALGHIDALLDRKETLVWTSPLQGAEANIRAAVIHLHDATKARELDDYALSASRALAYLEVARGRPNESGMFGGLEGVLANTVLGVPPGAQQQDACDKPSAAPSYGTHGGYLAWVAVPAGQGTYALAEDPGASNLSVQDGMIVLHTATAKLVAEACRTHANADPPDPPVKQATQATPPALYTTAQATEGKQIFAVRCVACHGTNLQGTAGPSVAGNDFLVTAQHNGWTLSIIRYIVFDLMPRNAPASLSPNDNADLMAFLLASNCYPAGTKPFPAADDPSFTKINLGPIPGEHEGQNVKGVCEVK